MNSMHDSRVYISVSLSSERASYLASCFGRYVNRAAMCIKKKVSLFDGEKREARGLGGGEVGESVFRMKRGEARRV